MALSTKGIEDLLVTKVHNAVAAFALYANFASIDYRTIETLPAALVMLSADEATEVRSRLISRETYQIVVITRKGQTVEASMPAGLCDAVRNAIHGKNWGYDDIDPFQYLGRELVDYEGENIAYALKFQTTHALAISSAS